MVNSIYEKQNDSQILKCIAAQKKEYNKAKIKKYCYDCSVLGFGIFSIVASYVNSDLITAIAFLFAVIIEIVGKYIDKYIIVHKKKAAYIQEYVDVSLYNFILKDNINDWGNIPSDTELAETFYTVIDKDIEEVKYWYSDYSKLTPAEQIYYCQKENLRWDNKLRNDFKNLIFTIFFIIILILVTTAFIIDPSWTKILIVLSWILPLIDFCYCYWNGLENDIKRLKDLKEKSVEIDSFFSKNHLYTNYKDNDERLEFIRSKFIELQKALFKHRENAILIPNWFYKVKKDKYQKIENKIAYEIQNMNRMK